MTFALALAILHAVHWLVLLGNVIYLRHRDQRATPASYPPLSVLIPARNEEDNLRRLLPTLAAQDYPDAEVIVYDDGSEDATWEVIEAHADQHIRGLQGNGPPAGWVGKVHALYQATREATGRLYLFLDADAELLHSDALRTLVERFAALPDDSVLTGLTRLRGGGRLLVSLVPNAILTGLPWPLVRRLPLASLGALNGQCWLIDATHYHRFEPHEALRSEVLEDVMIGRYLKAQGVTPALCNLQPDVAIHMYTSLGDAWRGFRKNAYLILGGHPAWFVGLSFLYLATFVLAPLASLWFLLSIYLLKAITDQLSGFSPGITLLAPVSYLLGSVMQWDSALSHWTGRVAWKGRRVGKA